MARVLPPIKAIRQSHPDAVLSIDTYKSGVAEAACKAGCRIINDVKGLAGDNDMAAIAADTGALLILNHWDDIDFQNNPQPIRDRLHDFFDTALDKAQKAGVDRSKIMLDPGIGFNKSLDDNLAILANLDWLKHYDLPLLIGTSRKSFIHKLTGEADPKQRTPGTLAADILCLVQRADAFRIHDVRAHRQALTVAQAVLRHKQKEPA